MARDIEPGGAVAPGDAAERDLSPSPEGWARYGANGWPRGISIALEVVGVIGMALVVLSSVTLGPHGPTGSPIERDVVAIVPSGAAVPVGVVSMTLGLLLVFGAWLALGLVLRRGASTRPLLRIAATWSAPLVIGPPLFSRDAYSNAAQGLMVAQHINPYTSGPIALHNSSFVSPLSSIWLQTHCPYGPLFLRLAQIAVDVSGRSLLGTILILRAYEVLGVVLIAVAIPTLARSVGKDPARAIWLAVCNPLVLFHFVGGAHNDSLMVGLLVAGLAVATTRRYGIAIVLCVLATTVKDPAAIGIVFVAAEAVRRAPATRRVAVAARLGAIAAAALGLISVVTRIGFGWIGALGVPGKNRSYLTPTTFAAHFLADVVGHDNAVLGALRILGMLVAAIGVLVLLWRAPQLGTARACGLALALVVVCGPVVLPWYGLWAIVVLAAVGHRIERGFAIFASVLLAIMIEPSGSVMPDVVLRLAVVLMSVVLVSIAWRPTRAWIRSELAPAIDHYRGLGALPPLPVVLRLVRLRAVVADHQY